MVVLGRQGPKASIIRGSLLKVQWKNFSKRHERRHLQCSSLYCDLEVWIGHPTVLVVVHLLQGHLNEVLDPLVPVLLGVPLLHQAALHHSDHLLLAK